MNRFQIVKLILTIWLFSYSLTGVSAGLNNQSTTNEHHVLSLTTASGNVHQIEIYGWEHEIVAPRDSATGLPTGSRQYQPIIITKAIDKATPLLLNILTNNESISTLRLDSWQSSDSATKSEPNRSIILTNPVLVGIKHDIREHLSVECQSIKWVFNLPRVEIEDDWDN